MKKYLNTTSTLLNRISCQQECTSSPILAVNNNASLRNVSLKTEGSASHILSSSLTIGPFSLSGQTSSGAIQKQFSHQCPFCMRFFHTPSKLARHVRSHTGEKPFYCTYCPHRASDKSNLMKHIYSQHETVSNELPS